MQPEQTPFTAGWWGTDLGKYRACDGTYCFYDYASLPPLESSLFDGSFKWLTPLADSTDRMMEIHRPPTETRFEAQLKALNAAASVVGLTLPSTFIRLMESRVWQDQIPSCTACYFQLSDKLVKSPLSDDGYLIRFLNDQQDVLMWYLYLSPTLGEAVVVSPLLLDEDEPLPPPEVLKNYLVFCAPGFEEFIYRFWLENTLWFALDEQRDLSPAEQAYVKHYQAD